MRCVWVCLPMKKEFTVHGEVLKRPVMMVHSLIFIATICKLATLVTGQADDVHQFNQGQGSPPKVGPPAHLMRDKAHIQDKDHILEHLDSLIGIPEEEMTEKQLQLHYFKLHDYDHNGKLDGLELINAMTHYHHEGSQDAEALKEDDLAALIDPIFRDDDKNHDGYIDYPEYAATTQS